MLRDSYHPRALSFLWTETQPCIPEVLEFVVSKKRQSLVIHVAQQTHRCLFFQAIIGPPMSLLRKGCQPLVHVVLEGSITVIGKTKQRGLAAVFLQVELWDNSTDNSQIWEFSHGRHLLGNSVIQSLGFILIVCFI